MTWLEPRRPYHSWLTSSKSDEQRGFVVKAAVPYGYREWLGLLWVHQPDGRMLL